METITKIKQLKSALLRGEVMTPLRAWERFGMAHNTYHRSIWSLKNAQKMPIKSRLTEEKGASHSMHWLEV